MIKMVEKEKCCGCSGCYNICPKNAIEMVKDEKGFRYPKINKKECIDCGLCEKVCPIINKKKINNNPKAFACYNKNEEIRKNSSSGGVFSLLAEYILNEGGVVYGAAFNGRYGVEHIKVDKKEELYKLRTSKYVQSNMKNIYSLAKEDLDNGMKVLFTGTPCQVNGFITYLNGKEYENLYTQDIICHGVPSPKVWEKYLEYKKVNEKSIPIKVNFRNKDNGWYKYEVLIEYNNGKYQEKGYNDLFMHAFLRNASLRDSCYACYFKEKNRPTDITLGDFWGIQNIDKDLFDNKGTSLVIVNSSKGQELFDFIKEKMRYKETDFEKSIKYNPSMYESPELPRFREEFFANLDNLEFEELVNKYTIKPRNANIIKRILRKLRYIIIKKIEEN